MSSENAKRTVFEPHQKVSSGKTAVVGTRTEPTEVGVSRQARSDPNTPRLPKTLCEDVHQKCVVRDPLHEKKSNPHVSVETQLSVPGKGISKVIGTSRDDSLAEAPSVDKKQIIQELESNKFLQANGATASDVIEDLEKKSSYRSSTKDSFASAGSLTKTSGSAKVSGTLDNIESGKSSICRGSVGTDVSDDSSCSSLSSSANKPHKANDSRWEAIQMVRSRDGALGLSHFRLLKRLGCGDIGSVYLSELNGTKCYFAMKVMDKGTLASRKKLLRTQTEREILQALDHPFLPTLYTHFETDKFSCLVMEFCPGGDLHTLRQRQPGKHFTEQAVKFYVAEVLLALEYLHMLGIIYRDLKPENVLVREDGHIMLSDFDLSLRCSVNPTLIKSSNMEADPLRTNNSAFCVEPACITPSCAVATSCFSPRLFSSKSKKEKKPKTEVVHQVSPLPELMAEPSDARSTSFVGTHEYLAPEIIKGEGHGSAVDWWTLGIFLYELLFARTPFKGSGNRATLFNVIGQPLRFPESPVVSFEARDLIRGLLVKEPQHRLAYKRGATEIKQHPFFNGVNWALIRCASPPEIPRPVEIECPPASTTLPSRPAPSVDTGQKSSENYLEFDFF